MRGIGIPEKRERVQMHDAFLGRLAQPRPDPGGGAAAAHGGLLALAIMEKIVGLELRRPQSADRDTTWKELFQNILAHREEFLALRERDGAAYLTLAKARAASCDESASADAWEEAVACPMSIMEAAADALRSVSAMGGLCGRHLVADLLVAAELLAASSRAASHIAGSNLNLMRTDATKDRLSQEHAALCTRTETELRSAQEQLRKRAFPHAT